MSASRALCAAPRHVYAGIISDKTDESLKCTIHYAIGTYNINESTAVTLHSGGRACLLEREYQPTPEATFTCRKVVSQIEIHDHEKIYSLEQLFHGVTSPVTEWRFDIHNDHIASINPATKIETPVNAPLTLELLGCHILFSLDIHLSSFVFDIRVTFIVLFARFLFE